MENFQDRGVWIRTRIRFVLRGWIRIRSISDRIRNPGWSISTDCSSVVFSSLHMNTYLKRFIIIWIASVMEGYSTTFLVIIKAYIHTGLTLFFLRVILFMLGAFSVFKYLIGVLTRVRRAETGNEQVRYFLTFNFPIISRSFLRPIDWAVSVGRSVIIS